MVWEVCTGKMCETVTKRKEREAGFPGSMGL